MSEWSQSFTLTKNVGWGFILCSTPPTQWTVWVVSMASIATIWLWVASVAADSLANGLLWTAWETFSYLLHIHVPALWPPWPTPLEQTLREGIWYHSLTQHLLGVSYPNLARYHLYTTVTDSAASQHFLLQSCNLKWSTQHQSVTEGETLVVCFLLKRLRWCRGSVLASDTQVCGFKPGQSHRIFTGQ